MKQFKFGMLDMLYVLSEYDVRHKEDVTCPNFGCCIENLKLIQLYHPQPEYEMLNTITHEFLHARSHQLGKPLTEKETTKLANDITKMLLNKS